MAVLESQDGAAGHQVQDGGRCVGGPRQDIHAHVELAKILILPLRVTNAVIDQEAFGVIKSSARVCSIVCKLWNRCCETAITRPLNTDRVDTFAL